MEGIVVENHGRLHLDASDVDQIEVRYTGVDGAERQWEPESLAGPILFEEVTYQFWADGTEHAPFVHHRDPQFTRDITLRPDRRSASGSFNLQRQVGTLAFVVTFGTTQIMIELEVVPTKIDYATDYQSLISEVASGARGLALAYMRSTHTGARHSSHRATEIEWLTALRQELEALQRALARVNAQPYRHLYREVRPTPNHKIRRLDSVARRAIMRGKGGGAIDEIDGIGPVRRTIDSVNAVTTLDTPEHRWLSLQVRQLHLQVQGVGAVLDKEARRSTSWIGERRKAERAELQHLADSLKRLQELDVLRHAQQAPQPSPPSLTLISAPGYRDAYRILTELRLGLAVEGEALNLQTKDIHDLYELWAFIEIVRIVAAHTGAHPDPTGLIRHHSGGLRIDLQAGTLSEIPIAGEPRSFTVAYNRVYPGQTGDQKPDIVVRVRESNMPDLILVLDAKYRVDATDEFRARYGAPGPPIDAINALHRYRDAIVIRDPGPTRPVVRCAALFPLTVEETPGFENHSELYDALSQLGVGALPFLPGNVDLASAWIGGLLTLPIHELAWNGPPGPTVDQASATGTLSGEKTPT